MVLSLMPGNGAVPSGGSFVAGGRFANSYRVTPDFHADTGSGGGAPCAAPGGCTGAPGASIVVRPCNNSDPRQAWQWISGPATGWAAFVMPFSSNLQFTLSCRNDQAHSCLPGDDLDLWYWSKTPNQLLNASLRPTLASNGVLQVQRQMASPPGTCIAVSANGLLRMAKCNEEDAKQQRAFTSVPGLKKAGLLQSIGGPNLTGGGSMCIAGTGETNPGGYKANWPPAYQFSQAAIFAKAGLVGVNGTFLNLDDLPLGAMGRGQCSTPPQPCIYSPDEQQALFTLYAITRSPIMFSGDLPSDAATVALVTNPGVLNVSRYGDAPLEVRNTATCASPAQSYLCSQVVWCANDTRPDHSSTLPGKFVAMFSTGGPPYNESRTVTVPLSVIGLESHGMLHLRNLWTGEKHHPRLATGSFNASVSPHGGVLFEMMVTPMYM